MTPILELGRLEDGGNVNCLKEMIMPGYGMGYGKKTMNGKKKKKPMMNGTKKKMGARRGR
jgi:hypothetical protein|tara:strand:- start:4611 stop:4790 length:180 start_codon:yes stop_codon:yes gene_type:complete